MEAVRSNLEFRSNLYPVVDDHWGKLKSVVMDPFGLEQMVKLNSYLSPSQRLQYQYSSEHCAFAFKDDYPWGTVKLVNGQEVSVCRCLNTSCSEFKKCRPDFDPEELKVLEDNRRHASRVTTFSAVHDINFSAAALEKAESVRIENEEQVTPFDLELEAEEPAVTGLEEAVAEFAAEAKAVPEISQVEAVKMAPEPEQIIQEDKTEEDNAEPAYPFSLDTPDHKTGFASFVTVPQEALIRLPAEARTIVNAGPGTGKTWTLIERIIDLINNQNVDPENIMILCFSRAAIEVVDQRLKVAVREGRLGYEYHSMEKRTFDSFGTFVISWVKENYPELLPAYYSFDGQGYDDRIRTATMIMKKKGDLLEQYQHIIVDEVQDLVSPRAELVLEMLNNLPDSCGFTLLGDACQSLSDWKEDLLLKSDGFYAELFRRWPDIRYWSFAENHRQQGALSQLAVPYREAILTGDDDARNRIVGQILSSISDSGIDVKKEVAAEKIREFRHGGTLGILTRTNGQALKISELLGNLEVEHVVQKDAGQVDYAPWIADVFQAYPNETVNEVLFTQCWLEVVKDSDPEKAHRAWLALLSTQFGEGKSRYSVEELLEGILRRGKNEELFVPNRVNAPVTVSNIHRAKGREFDSVLVLGEVLQPQENEKDGLQEHKIRYVAITRPKEKLADLEMKKEFLYKDGVSGRWYQGNSKRRYLTHFEVGLPGDVITRSFAESSSEQKFIGSSLVSGMRLRLLRSRGDTPDTVQYSVVLEDNENVVLGSTGPEFGRSLARALKRIKNISCDPFPELYPNMFSDIYVRDIVTCIGAGDADLPGAKTYGNLSVWKGYTLSGLARYDRDLY